MKDRGRRPGAGLAVALGLLLGAAAASPAGAVGPDDALDSIAPPLVPVEPSRPGAFVAPDLAPLAGRIDLASLAAPPRLGPLPRSERPAPGVTRAAVTLGPNVSGLPWRSGASCVSPAFEAWRGRRADVQVQFVWHDTWEMMLGRLTSRYYRGAIARTPQPVISLAMMPRSEFKQFARCAAGEFDGYFRQFGTILTGLGAGHSIVRIGWEPDVGSRAHPWGVDTSADAAAYVACFRREVAALKSTAPNVKIEWSQAKASALPFSVMRTYPGDAYVDIMGLHYYSIDDQFETQADWDALANSTRFGGPQGILRWSRTALRYGKRFAVPEWGVWTRYQAPEVGDVPLYIQNMFNFFRGNAANLAYENYYNCVAEHQIYPSAGFPNASALYQQLWRAGS